MNNNKTQFVKEIIGKMSIEQKVGAVLTLSFSGVVPTPNIYEAVTKFHCGGLRLTPNSKGSGSYIDPATGKTIVKITASRIFYKHGTAPVVSACEYKSILDELQAMAKKRPLGIPLHFSYDQEGDCGNLPFSGIRQFPVPMGLKATGDKNLTYEAALAAARQARAIGCNFIHSPVLDVNTEPSNPEVNIRAYSDKAEEVAEWAIESCRGYKKGRIITTGKHFPGRGDSKVDAHFHIPVIDVDKDTLLKRELLPYRVLIEQDLLPAVMLAHSIYPAFDENEIATVSKKIVTGILRDELGFEGVVTTDSMTMGGIAIRHGIAQACAMSLAAGADLVLMKAENSLVEECYNEIMKWVIDKKITEQDLNSKVYRILSLKYDYGLFDDKISEENPEDVIRDEKIIALSQEIARKSVMLARDRHNILPLSKHKRILVIEQLYAEANNYDTHPGMLFKYCAKINPNLSYLEVSISLDKQDKENIHNISQNFGTIIMTNFFHRQTMANNNNVRNICVGKSKKLVLISNTPYELSIPEEADTVIISYGYYPESMEAVAKIIFGEARSEGVWPVSNGVAPRQKNILKGGHQRKACK